MASPPSYSTATAAPRRRHPCGPAALGYTGPCPTAEVISDGREADAPPADRAGTHLRVAAPAPCLPLTPPPAPPGTPRPSARGRRPPRPGARRSPGTPPAPPCRTGRAAAGG